MQSSNHAYLANLDHLRAFAAFEVMVWHTHKIWHCPPCIALNDTVALPFFSLLAQGHSGVSLFMCISGYIFAYLTDGKKVSIPKFWINRFLRIFPLLLFWGCVTMLIHGYDGVFPPSSPAQARAFFDALPQPRGTWSIYVEAQYYLLFPVLLFCLRKTGPLPLIGLAIPALIFYRYLQWVATGTVQIIAFFTIIGRADQLLLGTAAFYTERWIKRSFADPKNIFHALGLAGMAMLLIFYEYFNWKGGVYHDGGYPSPDPLWIVMPTFEGLCYALILMSYMQLRLPARADRVLSWLGKLSYSTYLGHFQLVLLILRSPLIIPLVPTAFYGRLPVMILLVYPVVILCSVITYRFIEAPFLRLRLNYLQPLDNAAETSSVRAHAIE